MGNSKTKSKCCQYEECKNKLSVDNIKNEELFCVKHRCHITGCKEEILGLGDYCKYHKCKYLTCSRECHTCGFCNMHSSMIK